MTQTAELRGDGGKTLHIPSRDEPIHGITSFEIPTGENVASVIEEAGVTRFDAADGCHWEADVEQTTAGKVVQLEAVEGEPVERFTFPYRDAYTLSEKVSEIGIPETEAAEEAFYYMPHMAVEMEWDPNEGESEVTGVEIGGIEYDIIER